MATGIDIAAMDAAQKLAFAQATGMILLTSGTITSPVSYFDLALPAGYAKYLLYWQFKSASPDNVSGAFSADGGTTFFNDHTDYDSYLCNFGSMYGGTFAAHAPELNSVFYFGAGGDSADGATEGATIIFPGDASSPPMLRSEGQFIVGPTAIPAGGFKLAWYQAGMTDPDYLGGRMNLVRILPEGNGDVDPPTSGEMFASGSYSLFGLI